MIAVAACSLPATPIGDLFNTGQGVSNGTDLNWRVDGRPAFVTDQSRFPFPYWVPNASSAWISPQAEYSAATDERNRTYVFSTRFNLPDGFAAAYIAMRLATDNALVDVRLNGGSVPLSRSTMVLPGNTEPMSVIAQGTGFSAGLGPTLEITGGFLPGENILELHVRNSATGDRNESNPTGLVAGFTSDVQAPPADPVATPEPGTLVLVGAGLALAGGAAARKRSIG
jgi:hypothetical protein